jgi:hypothetical protein
MSMQPVVVHGWTLFALPLILSQVHALSKIIVLAWVNDDSTAQ